MIERDDYNADGSLANKTKFKYDDNGNAIEAATYEADKMKYFTKYNYTYYK